MNDKRCETCRHWGAWETEADPRGKHMCDAIDDYIDNGLLAVLRSHEAASLYTDKDFSCALWEAKLDQKD